MDDAIVVLENIFRRMAEHGETPLVAAYNGSRQVGFAVVATSLVLVAVFVPITFLQGDVGRLFSEFALTMAAAVAFSSLVALRLSPMLASKILTSGGLQRRPDREEGFRKRLPALRRRYRRLLVGLAAKNGILIVEFANQLRAQGIGFDRAVLTAAQVRLRPIVMTGITTAAGSVPLMLSSGAGAEIRMVIGTVVLAGVLSATVFTLLIVPAAYRLLSRHSRIPGEVARRLEQERRQVAKGLAN